MPRLLLHQYELLLSRLSVEVFVEMKAEHAGFVPFHCCCQGGEKLNDLKSHKSAFDR